MLNPATRLDDLHAIDHRVNVLSLKAYARDFRRRWRRNKEAFDTLPEEVTSRLEEEFERSPNLSPQQSRLLALEIGIMRAVDVDTWFKTRRVTEGLRNYGREIRRRLDLQIEQDIVDSLQWTAEEADSSMLAGLELLFDPNLAYPT